MQSIISIRRLAPGDASAFQKLRLQALRDCPIAFGSSHEEECDTPVTAVAERLAPFADRGVFGAFHQTELIGTIGLGRENMRKLAHKGFIWGMFVAPAFRTQGVGHQLVRCALDAAAAAEGLRQVNLYVNRNNAAAIKLYERMGFISFGLERGAMLVNGELQDEILMTCVIAR